MNKFRRINPGAPFSMAVWSKGDDTCSNPSMEIHAPNPTRPQSPDKWLLFFADASERQFKPLAGRKKWLSFPTYRSAQTYAKGIK